MFYRGPFRGDNNFFNYPANLFWKLSNLIFPPPPPRLELYRERPFQKMPEECGKCVGDKSTARLVFRLLN